MKRIKNITLHLTEQESELIERIAELTERKPAELARLLLCRAALQEWTRYQMTEHNPDAEPLTPLRFNN